MRSGGLWRAVGRGVKRRFDGAGTRLRFVQPRQVPRPGHYGDLGPPGISGTAAWTAEGESKASASPQMKWTGT